MSDVKKHQWISRKKYRQLQKKLHRKRKRQKIAKKRDDEANLEEQEKLTDRVYQRHLVEAKALKLAQEELQEEIRRQNELKWMETERKAQEEFSMKQNKLEELQKIREQQKEELREQKRQELERKEQIRKAQEQLAAQALKEFESLQQQIDLYTAGLCDVPEQLKSEFQTNPTKESCIFFAKTSVCRYGDKCVKNHIKPGISKVRNCLLRFLDFIFIFHLVIGISYP